MEKQFLINMMYLSTPQLLFIIIVPIVVLVVIFIFFFLPIRKYYRKKHYLEVYYKNVRSIAVDRDYYLINNFKFKISDNKKAMFNHILFGEKYIYLIYCVYYQGDITGNVNDNYLIMVPKKDKRKYATNDYRVIKRMVDRFVLDTSLSSDIFIGIVLTNSDVNLGVESESKQFYMIQRDKLAQLVKAIESRNIPTLNEKELERAVTQLAKRKAKEEKRG